MHSAGRSRILRTLGRMDRARGVESLVPCPVDFGAAIGWDRGTSVESREARKCGGPKHATHRGDWRRQALELPSLLSKKTLPGPCRERSAHSACNSCPVTESPDVGCAVLKLVVDAGVPALVFSAMAVVGMELTANDFRSVIRQPVTVLAATAGQFILLPAIGCLLVRSLRLQPAVEQGVLLVAACPSGAMANVYTYLARGNVALSVTLTAVSSLAAVLTTPAALAVLRPHGGESSGPFVPAGKLAAQLFFLLLLPVLVGMAVRHRWPEITRRHGRVLLGTSVAALAALLAIVILQEAEQFASTLVDLIAATGALTVLAFGAGWTTGWISAAGATDRFTLGMVFVVRNVGIATAIAVTALGRVEFAVFATAYFLVQVPLLLAAALVFRSWRAGEVNTLGGIEQP
jgi:bile acid:Na+ symporter, BASS family